MSDGREVFFRLRLNRARELRYSTKYQCSESSDDMSRAAERAVGEVCSGILLLLIFCWHCHLPSVCNTVHCGGQGRSSGFKVAPRGELHAHKTLKS